MKAYLVIVYHRSYYDYELYTLSELFRQVVFNEEQLNFMIDNFEDVDYIKL